MRWLSRSARFEVTITTCSVHLGSTPATGSCSSGGARPSIWTPEERRRTAMQITRNTLDTERCTRRLVHRHCLHRHDRRRPCATRTSARAAVHFTPGARTAWHTHPHGQTIFVTEGVGLCQREGGPIEVIRPGDRVFFEPGEKHWHGAAPTRLMTHVAMQFADESGSPVTWGEHVSDDAVRPRNGHRRLATSDRSGRSNSMRGVVMYAPGDVRVEDARAEIVEPTDAIIRARARPASAAPTSGPTAASRRVDAPMPMGHEYVGVVEEVGADVADDQGRRLRRRLVLRLRQHLRDLPGGVPERTASTRSRSWRRSAPRPSWCAIPLRRRDPRRHTAAARPATDPGAARGVRRARHRLVRGRRRRGRPRQDGRRRRRRRRRAARHPRGEAARRRADHRDVAATPTGRSSPATSARPTSSRSAATRACADQGAHRRPRRALGRSRPSARRSR